MIAVFLSHQRKGFWRSRNKTGSIAAQVVMGFFILYFVLIAIALGLGMEHFIQKIFPGQDVIKVFNGFILYYFLLDFAMRFQLQELPTLSIVPYLHLNIPKSKLVSFLNTKALFTFFNLLPIFIFLPFCFLKLTAVYGGFAACMYVLSIFSLSVFNNYLVLYIKRKSISNYGYVLAALAVMAAFGLLEFYKIISVSTLSDALFKQIAASPALGFAFVFLAGLMFKINAAYLRNNLYTEELSAASEKKGSTDYAFLNRFGKVGELAALELKLILRHKRSRTSLLMGFIVLFYGFLFYKQKYIQNDGFGTMLFAAIFMTGISFISYGQFMFGWQSAHFDGLLSNKINFRDFIKAKFLLFTIASTSVTILASFYGFLSWKLLVLHLAAYLYNIGLSTVLVLYMATFNYKRLDLTSGASFNWQGVGATQWILILPCLLLPLLIYMPFGLMNKPYWGLFALGMIGLIALLMRGFWINYLTAKFEQKRYKIAEGFRE